MAMINFDGLAAQYFLKNFSRKYFPKNRGSNYFSKNFSKNFRTEKIFQKNFKKFVHKKFTNFKKKE